MTHSNHIKELRVALGMTKAEFAKSIGCTPMMVYNIETGKQLPGFETILKLEDFFGVSIRDLYGRR